MTEAEWLSCADPEAMLKALRDRKSHRTRAGRRRLRLFACGCCRLVWHKIAKDATARRFVETAEAFADGQVEVGVLVELVHGADDAPGQRVRRPSSAKLAARAACAPSLDYLEQVCELTADAAGGAPERIASTQAALLRDIFGNPFRPVTFPSSWRTDTALSLARATYESRDFGAMPILADALQDAGCDNDDNPLSPREGNLLGHCRDTSLAHVRGCWVVDLVLGKSR